MTLVEILAALVILGIVFVGFMTVFPQMTNFNEKTETKLETMNAARILLEEFTKKSYSEEYFSKSSEFLYDSKNDHWIKTVPLEDNLTTINYKVAKNLVVNQNNAADSRELGLRKVYISINKKGTIISKTFGYIKVN